MKTKNCAFTQCEKTFEEKNPKKRFCCLSCKNKAAYNYYQKTYPWEIKQYKARRKNIQILEYLCKTDKQKVTRSELRLLGFDEDSAIIPTYNSQNQPVYRYGNTTLTLITLEDCEINKI
jgi:hypothetical protein